VSLALPLPLRLAAARGYPIFDKKKHDLNIIIIRAGSKPDAFDDIFSVSRLVDEFPRQATPETFKSGVPRLMWETRLFACTVDPGLVYAKDPMNPKGTAHLAPGHYPRSHRRGLHKGTPALVQVGPVTVRRDADRDGDTDENIFETGIFGINAHSTRGEPVKVGRWSAGCAVLPLVMDMDWVLTAVDQQEKAGLGSLVSLTVLEVS